MFKKIVLWAGMSWGGVMLGMGALASFTIGPNDTPLTLAGFSLVSVLPLVTAIAAWRMARLEGILLILSAPAALFCLATNGADALHVMSKIYLWLNIAFGVLFLLIGRFGARSDEVEDAETRS